MQVTEYKAIKQVFEALGYDEDAAVEGAKNRRERRALVFGYCRRRADKTTFTKPSKKLRKQRSRAANARAKQSRRANR